MPGTADTRIHRFRPIGRLSNLRGSEDQSNRQVNQIVRNQNSQRHHEDVFQMLSIFSIIILGSPAGD